MILSFTPLRSDAVLEITRKGDSLKINGKLYDFGAVPEGAILPQEAVDCPELASDVTREGGAIRLTLILPHGANSPKERCFPAPIVLRKNGPVALPSNELILKEVSDDH